MLGIRRAAPLLRLASTRQAGSLVGTQNCSMMDCWGGQRATVNDKDAWEVLGPEDFELTMAVPKRKVTPSKKKMRATHKHWRPVTIVAQCSYCGRVMGQHELHDECLKRGCGQPEPAPNVSAGGSK